MYCEFGLKDKTADGCKFAGNYHDLVEDTDKTNSYIDNALKLFLEKYKDHCNLPAYEIMNEPEWAISENDRAGVKRQVDLQDMQRFAGMIAAAVHRHTDQQVKLGSASIRWNSFSYNAATTQSRNREIASLSSQ